MINIINKYLKFSSCTNIIRFYVSECMCRNGFYPTVDMASKNYQDINDRIIETVVKIIFDPRLTL